MARKKDVPPEVEAAVRAWVKYTADRTYDGKYRIENLVITLHDSDYVSAHNMARHLGEDWRSKTRDKTNLILLSSDLHFQHTRRDAVPAAPMVQEPPLPGDGARRLIHRIFRSPELREFVFDKHIADMHREMLAAADVGKFRGTWWPEFRCYGALFCATVVMGLRSLWKASLSEAGKLLLRAGLLAAGTYLLQKVAEAWKALK